MIQRVRGVLLVAAVLAFLPGLALAQVGNIAGTVRDSQGAVLPGVTVEATSPVLIEKVRSTVSDANGRYQIVSLPPGTYKVTFKLERFATVERANIEISSDFTAPVNAELKLGAQSETVTVVGTSAPLVDVQNARQRQVITGDELKDLPITHNLNSLVNLIPGIAISTAGFSGNSVPTICSGGIADAAAGAGSTSGPVSGCGPILNSFNAHSSMNDAASLNEGRIQVDGLGIQSFGGGGRSSYIADIGNAQEVSFTLSGSLGESETGGTTINIVPRTGGNKYAGQFFYAYSNGHFFGKNNETRTSTFQNRVILDYDVNGAYGGPILRDRLWFYGSARRQQRDGSLFNAFRNANEGVFGANYQMTDEHINQGDLYQNGSMRLTYQATKKDKFNVYWDEQYTCENPCGGTANAFVSIEAQGTPLTYPLRVVQLSWTNPFTNKILFDGGISYYSAHRNEGRNLDATAYPALPRVVESGALVDVVNAAATSTITSGSINNAIDWQIHNIQSRASASYVTGSHNIKLGYQGQFLSRLSNPHFNDLRLQYGYTSPAATCTTTPPTSGNVNTGNTWCGFLSPGVPNPATSPFSLVTSTGTQTCRDGNTEVVCRFPVPNTVTQYIPSGSDEKGWFAAFYLQDQWTWNRFTLSGALRYDNAQSKFDKTCVGPDVYTQYPYCLNDPAQGDNGRGVYFQDITPRFGAAWDVFGNGKTALKWSMGKYLDGAQINIGSIYVASNPASGGRTVNQYTRLWRDINGDRIVDCDLTIPEFAPSGNSFPNNGECGPMSDLPGSLNTARRFGRSPDSLDDSGLAIGLGTLYCGQYERSMSQAVVNYCNNYFKSGGSGLLDGWNKRRYEWQTSIGVQHEIMPRLSAEVTYNRRNIGNLTVTDLIGSGCDLYSSSDDPNVTADPQTCMQNLLNFNSSTYDFYSITAPQVSGLPGGGGYVVPGIATLRQASYVTNADGTKTVTYVNNGNTGVRAVTIAPKGANPDYWSGVDTNFTLRAKYGVRLSGGTSTGRRNVSTCGVMVDDPPTGQVLEEGRERTCDRVRIFQTNVRGTASYTIPWMDVLTSATFSYRPGVNIQANYQVAITDLTWISGARYVPEQLSGVNNTFVTQNMLSNDTYGEGIRLFDIKLAKNVRVAGKRVNVGADIFNAFNSDGALGYCGTLPSPSQGVTGCAGGVPWRAVTNITTPRYVRFQMQFDF